MEKGYTVERRACMRNETKSNENINQKYYVWNLFCNKFELFMHKIKKKISSKKANLQKKSNKEESNVNWIKTKIRQTKEKTIFYLQFKQGKL